MLYELRHYDVPSSRAMDQVLARFADHTLGIWKRMQIEPAGFWTVTIGTPSPRLTYLLVWEDLGQRQTRWDAFSADPQWRQARAESEKAFGGSPIQQITSSILKPTAASRLPRIDNQPARLQGGVFELRTYQFHGAEKMEQAVQWFAEQGLPAFEAHGMFAMGLWTTYLGVAPRLQVMLVFENLAHRERAWASFYTDPEWPARQDGLYANGQPLIARTESCVMKGTEFSGWS